MYKTIPFFLIAGLAATVLTAPCAAEENFLKQPTVDYSADEIMDVGAPTVMRSKIFYSKGNIRKEQAMEGNKSIMIINLDTETMWMLMPDQNMYMEMEVPPAESIEEDISGDYAKNTVIVKKLGKEDINGIKAEKLQVTIKDPDGDYDGLMWQSKGGIIVKMELTPEDRQVITLELNNVRVGPQDPGLFEIPSGYTKMGMPGFGGMMQGLMGGMME